MYIERKYNLTLKKYLENFPAVGIIGPRQVGKTSFIKKFLKTFNKKHIYLDLELQTDLIKLTDPEFFLKQHEDYLVVIDEVQRLKELYPLLRALIDQKNTPSRFILLGSASPELIRNSSESLAGRIIYLNINPFDLTEISNIKNQNELWINGGFPKSLLAKDRDSSQEWLGSFIRTYLEKDLPMLGLRVSPVLITRLWTMLAHLNGQMLNYSLLSKSLEASSTTIKSYIDFLENAFLVKRLYPYSHNISKRLIKSPKIYLTDTGILHYLLSIQDYNSLLGYHSVGNSWESFVINQISFSLNCQTKIYFFRTREGSECDLIFEKGNEIICTAEIKFTNSPKLSRGNHNAIEYLKSINNFIITPSSDDFLIKENIRICKLEKFITHYVSKLLL